MSQENDPSPELPDDATNTDWVQRKRIRWKMPLLATSGLILIALGAAWLSRDTIAEDLISEELDSLGVPARYEIVSIGPNEQVIRNLSIGDPSRPDLTVKELRVKTTLRWGFPSLGRITVVQPRLYGALRGGKLSFGSLDKVIYSQDSKQSGLPDYDVSIEDGRALLESQYGRLGLKLSGSGPLRSGFEGELAAVTPSVNIAGCETGRTTFFGKVTSTDGAPRFTGPLRLQNASCADQNFYLSKSGLVLDVTLDKALDGGEAVFSVNTGNARQGVQSLRAMTGSGRATYRKNLINASFKSDMKGVQLPQAQFAKLGFGGHLRATPRFDRFEIEGDVDGNNVQVGHAVEQTLISAKTSAEGTFAAPLLEHVRTALHQELRSSRLNANIIARNSDDGLSLVVTHGSLRGRSGASLLSLSRIQALFGNGVPHVTGNFATGGKDLPQVWGRMESRRDGQLSMQVSMPDYRAGTAKLAIPRLSLKQAADGALAFSGQVLMSGEVPGGSVQNVLAPVDGHWAADGQLSIWRKCTNLTFDSLQISTLSLNERNLVLCPSQGRAIVQGNPKNISVAFGTSALKLSGSLGESPIKMSSGPVGFKYGGNAPNGLLSSNNINVVLGSPNSESSFLIGQLDANLGPQISGTFKSADITLAAVPLDMRQAAGNWSFPDNVVLLNGAQFTLLDRQRASRFEPMIARDANLRFADGKISARALLREPLSDRQIVQADITHTLNNSTGAANLSVPGIVFDQRLPVHALSGALLGFVSQLEGTVKGRGRIVWGARGVTSTGRFTTDGLNFAAPMGPIQGLQGEVNFTDLLGMVTAPKQTVRIASMNPGIEVLDGELSYEIKPNYLVQINGAQWPFMDGVLNLDPANMQIGSSGEHRYTLRVTGLNAATFIQHLEVSNLSATGTFDGEMPLVFDEQGGRVENGFLVSRSPGGNVSYNGALTYKDLSTMANFAFDALRSVNYKSMEIGLGGSLSGNLVTRINFDGLSQGEGASKNFITRQIAKLPIRFVVNVKAPFFSLFGSMRSLYDPNFVTDPRTLGLLNENGEQGKGAPYVAIQPPVSEKKP